MNPKNVKDRDTFIKAIQEIGKELDSSTSPEMLQEIAEEMVHDLHTFALQNPRSGPTLEQLKRPN